MDMEETNQIMLARVSLTRDEDGRRAARLVGLSMGLLFSVILVLQAISW
jgi:tetrahydromethanopterin S-methyltransferase subunit F